jgi:hypothetical protein
MATFRPPVTATAQRGDPNALTASDSLFRHYKGTPEGNVVWKDQAGAWHQSPNPYGRDLEEAAEVYLGGHEYTVDETKRNELVAAGFFVGGHWTEEEAKWINYILNAEVNRGFRAGDATASLHDPSGDNTIWVHADTIVGTLTPDGFHDQKFLVKNSLLYRSTSSGAYHAQLYATGSGIAPAWEHPSPTLGFTPMDLLWDGVPGSSTAYAIGWSEPADFSDPLGEGVILRLGGFFTAAAWIGYPMGTSTRFHVTAVHQHDGFHYMLIRHWDLSLLLPAGWTIIENNAQRNWNRVGRVPVGQFENFAAWEFWDGSEWITDQAAFVAADQSIIKDTREQSIEGIGDITYHNGEWILAVISPSYGPTVNLYRSSAITGPWQGYYSSPDKDLAPLAGPHPPRNTFYWSGYPKFHEWLYPDDKTLLITHSHGLYGRDLQRQFHPSSHASQPIPNFIFLPTPEAASVLVAS